MVVARVPLGLVHAESGVDLARHDEEQVREAVEVDEGVLAHRLRAPSEELVTLMTSIIALSPGTMTADVDPDSTTIYVHFLLLRDLDAARASLCVRGWPVRSSDSGLWIQALACAGGTCIGTLAA